MSLVSVQIDGEIAVVTINNPPINAASYDVRAGLVEALDQTDRSNVKAVVLICEGRTFVAGADVREFGVEPKEPHLPDVLTMIQNAPRPWVAAIHGTALGGGCELALVCAYRIADKGAKFGFPEVNLGLIPGAGGTVRLPRLISSLDALELIVTGKPVGADKALALGLVDQISDENLLLDAKAFAATIASKPLPTPLDMRTPIDLPTSQDWDAAVKKLTGKARGQTAPLEAADAVRDALDLSATDALAKERQRFLRLKDEPQSAALRHVFFAERAASRLPHLKSVAPRPLDQIGVIGGGTMGAGIAAAMLMSGLQVVLIERDDTALKAGIERVSSTLSGSLNRKLISQNQFDEMTKSIAGSTDYAALADADLVIEAVFEDMGVKKDVFSKLDNIVKSAAILATNTSYLDVAEIADSIADPSRMIGLHFFSPAHIMKLLEIVHHPKIADDILATGFALAKRLRKIAVPAGVCDGFIGNRVMSAYRRECDYMLEDGALPEQIDAAMREFGFAMGIYAMQDLAGLDIGWAMRKRQAATRDPKARYVSIADSLCEAARLGRKTGKGWFDYSENKMGMPDPDVTALIVATSAEKNLERVPFSSEQIMARILNSMQTEGADILQEGVAQTSDAIDVVMVNGYGFPRWRGGPMHMETTSKS